MPKYTLIFLCSIYFSLSQCKAQDWQFNNLEIKNQDAYLIIEADSITSPYIKNDISNIHYKCSSQQIYPTHYCRLGRLNFTYEKKSYDFNVSGTFDFLKNLWDFKASNSDNSIVLKTNSITKNLLEINITKVNISQLIALIFPEYMIDEEAKSATITAQISVDFSKALTIQMHYEIEKLSQESNDGDYILSESSLSGDLTVTELTNGLNVLISTDLNKGEGLFKDIYIAFDETPVNIITTLQLDNNFNPLKTQFKLSATDAIKLKVDLLDWQTNKAIIHYNITDLSKFYNGFLASYMEILGVEDLETIGESSGLIQIQNNDIQSIDAQITQLYLAIDSKKIAFNNLFADIKWHNTGAYQTSILNWDSLILAGMPISESEIIINAVGEQLKLPHNTSLPIFDGHLTINQLELKDLFKDDIAINFDGEITPISLALITQKMGWQSMNGTISGKIPAMKKTGQTITFDGALNLKVFDGQMHINNLSIERLFGIAPVVAADIKFMNLNLKQITSTFDFGEINGLINGYVNKLRITNWKADRLDAHIESKKTKGVKQTISQRAIDNISSIGGLQGALSRSFLRFFDDFKYKKIAIGCRLRNSICQMSGIIEDKTLDNNTYKLIEGKGIPSINIIGFRKFIDWEIFIDRLLNAGY